MVIIENDLQKFWSYLSNVGDKYFGKNYLSPETVLLFYLEYDVSKNFTRKYIIENITENDHFLINQAIVSHIFQLPSEKAVVMAMDNQYPVLKNFCNFPVCEDLAYHMKKWIDTANSVKCDISYNLDSFIFEVLLYSDRFSKDPSVNNRISTLLKDVFSVDILDLVSDYEKYIASREVVKEDMLSIPDNLKNYLSVINGYPEEYNISFKDFENAKSLLYAMLQKRKLNNIEILGPFGSGRKALVYKLAYEIANKSCPDYFYDYKIIKIDLLKILSEKYDVKIVEKIVRDIISFLNKQLHIIVFIDNFYELNFDYGINVKLSYLLFPILTNPKYRVIVTELEDANVSNAFFKDAQKIRKKFITIHVVSPEKEDLHIALKNTLKQLTYYHGVFLSKEMYNLSILYSNTFRGNEYPYVNIKDTIDVEMSNACINCRSYVTEDDIKLMYVSILNDYSKYTAEYKESTALHEAGHYVVKRFCTHYQVATVKLISIIPTGDAAGFNSMEYDITKIKDNGYDFYTEMIATYLGGRAAEELFVKTISAGASTDLEVSSEIARLLISNFSLGRKNGKEKIKVNESLQSELSVNRVDKQANKIINYCYQMALNILLEHQDYVLGLADLLLENSIISSDEIKKHEKFSTVTKIVKGKKITVEVVEWI